jgi:hypothetical protein
MRRPWVLLILLPVSFVSAQDTNNLVKRYGFDANLEIYPQKTPQEALRSVCKALDNNRVDYMLAQLADPRYVDEKVASYKSAIRQGDDKAKGILAFDRLVHETAQYFLEDPTIIKELRRFAKDAEWKTDAKQAVGTLASIEGRKVYLRKYADRWFLENKQSD